MKSVYKCLFVLLVVVVLFPFNVEAANSTTYVNIETNEISFDGKTYESITKYDTLEEFLEKYNSNKLPEIYLTSFLFDGVSSVKSLDLDDFIESDSNNVKVKTLNIEVLNICAVGNVELTGKTTGFMVAVNTNGLKGNLNVILNNVDIDTDSKKAPAIYVYNKDITYTDCIVTIKTKAGTNNFVEGGKFKKVSLMPSDKLASYASYYLGNALSNYEKYSSYYGVYTASELDNILFATVKADREDLQDGDPYYFYKGSGAISSDIDLYFEGEGYLKVTSKNKEGIETKGNLTFSGGTGDYEIFAQDDCLNTTTASSAGNNVRNSLTIDVASLVAIVSDEGDEGDAIDSNGSLTINGGNIYAFAHGESGDAGLDSETGTYINGGEIIATGNMADRVASESTQKYIYVNFKTKIGKDTLIVIKDENDKIITAFKTSKDMSTLLYSSEDLEYDSFKIYSGGVISGTEINGLYTKIDSYEGGRELEDSEVSMLGGLKNQNRSQNGNSFILKMLICEVVALALVGVYCLCDKYLIKRKSKFKD